MSIKSSYLKWNQTLQSQYREPAWGWGFRVGFSVVIPLIWGFATGNTMEAEWMAIAAECVSFIDLKGNIGQRIRILLSAAILSVVFCFVGSFAGSFVVISVLGMLVVGFLSGLFKNLGDHGMGLALSVYIFYIITSSYPLHELPELLERCKWVALGALWTIVVSSLSFLFIRVNAPYRKTIGDIWKAVAELALVSGKGWDGRSKKSSVRDIYLKEKTIRTAIDSSLSLFEVTIDQIQKTTDNLYPLTQSRKSASLVGLNLVQIAERADDLWNYKPSRQLTVQISVLFRSIQQIGERMEVFLISLKSEEKILVKSRMERLNKTLSLLQEGASLECPEIKTIVNSIYDLGIRINKLVDHALLLLEDSKESRVISAYSFTETLNILHPKYLKNNIKLMFNFNSYTTRYALRLGISAMIAALIAHLFFKNHGYWIPFTTIIVSQPYFGATLKKGLQRSGGTIAGIIVGFAFLSLPFPGIARIVLVFISSVLLIFYLRRNYAFAAFFITLFLVGLLGLEPHYESNILTMRIIATLIGSALAIVSGFVLLPTWDKDKLPEYLAEAMMANMDYFKNTFYNDALLPWTKLKRAAEIKNANAFDSLSRFMQEPTRKAKSDYDSNFYFITHSVRITRELNNFNSELEWEEDRIKIDDKEKYLQILSECDDLFREICSMMIKNGNKFFNDKYFKSFPVNGFNTYTPTIAQSIYVEKLLIELKFIEAGLDK